MTENYVKWTLVIQHIFFFFYFDFNIILCNNINYKSIHFIFVNFVGWRKLMVYVGWNWLKIGTSVLIHLHYGHAPRCKIIACMPANNFLCAASSPTWTWAAWIRPRRWRWMTSRSATSSWGRTTSRATRPWLESSAVQPPQWRPCLWPFVR